jgi:hypothetical protein
VSRSDHDVWDLLLISASNKQRFLQIPATVILQIAKVFRPGGCGGMAIHITGTSKEWEKKRSRETAALLRSVESLDGLRNDRLKRHQLAMFIIDRWLRGRFANLFEFSINLEDDARVEGGALCRACSTQTQIRSQHRWWQLPIRSPERPMTASNSLDCPQRVGSGPARRKAFAKDHYCNAPSAGDHRQE